MAAGAEGADSRYSHTGVSQNTESVSFDKKVPDSPLDVPMDSYEEMDMNLVPDAVKPKTKQPPKKPHVKKVGQLHGKEATTGRPAVASRPAQRQQYPPQPQLDASEGVYECPD